jgi:hypothetical protein
MRFLLAMLLTASLSFIAGIYLPWWSIALVAFGVALLVKQRIGMAYLSAFAAIFFLWGGLSFLLHFRNQGMLSEKIARLFPLQGQTILLILLTAFLGALVAGFAAMSGSSLRPVEKRYLD